MHLPQKPLNFSSGTIDLTHGSGGRNMAQLIDELFIDAFDNPALKERNDQALINTPPHRLVITTDSHVVSPLFFPGGDIGSLSIHGTINDVAMSGATPLALAAGFILEEGFPLSDLRRIVLSMAAASKSSNVPVVTGDTKVVEKGKGDGVFITTTGIGLIPEGVLVNWRRIAQGDAILVNGPIGDHGSAIMVARHKLKLESSLLSDSAPLHELVKVMLASVPDLHCLRDPTRGGVAATLNELASQSTYSFTLKEDSIPIRTEVRAICEILGIDPLNIANEGKLIAFCAPNNAEQLLKAMRSHPLGREAAIIGSVETAHDKKKTEQDHRTSNMATVHMETSFGGRRVIQWISGEQLPRIC